MAKYADCGEAGSGRLEDVRVDMMNPVQDLLVLVGGAGVVRGRVVDARGNGISYRRLRIALLGIDSKDSRPPLDLAGANGRTLVLVTTDGEGDFEVNGLRRAEFEVRAARPGLAEGFPALLTSEPVRANGVPLKLRWLRPHLHVRMLDREGESLWAGQTVDVKRESFQISFGWPTWPVLHVIELGAGGTKVRNFQVDVARRGAFDVAVLDGRDYRVMASGGVFDGAGQVVHVPRGSDRVDVLVKAPPESALGELTTVVFADGKLLPRSAYHLTLHSFSTGLEFGTQQVASLLRDESDPVPGATLLRVPAGRYRLAAYGAGGPGVGAAVHLRTLGRVEAVVVVRAGEMTSSRLDLDPGGTLEVQILGEPSAADVEAMESAQRTLWGPGSGLAAMADTVSLRVVHAGRPAEAVHRVALEGWEWNLDRWHFGATGRSEMLAVGPYELIGTSTGGREARLQVTISAGETTRVSLRFEGP